MKKYLLASIMALSFSANAQWYTIADSENDEYRLQVDQKTFTISKDDGIYLLGAIFRIVNDGEPGQNSAFVISAESCTEDGGKMLQRRYNGKEWITTKNYFWSRSGSKLYDQVGVWLCDTAIKGLKKRPGEKDL